MGFTENGLKEKVRRLLSQLHALRSDDDIYYCMRWRLKLEGETEKGCWVPFLRQTCLWSPTSASVLRVDMF